MHEEAKKFFVNYFKQIALVFGGAWNGRKYSIRSASALRAFVRVAPDVIRRLDQEHADRGDFRAIGRVIAPWGRRIGDLRFETEGAWKRSGTTVDSLAKELRLALQYPEGRRGLCSVWTRCSSPAAPGSSARTSSATRSTTPPSGFVVVDKLTYAGSLLNLDGALHGSARDVRARRHRRPRRDGASCSRSTGRPPS